MSGGVERKKRQPPLSVRLNAEERLQLESQAGALPLSSYIKSVVLADDAPRYRASRKPPVEDQRLLAELLARLGSSRLASNLNQIAKSAHLGVLPVDPDLERELHQACLDVAWMRVCLTEALGIKGAQSRPRQNDKLSATDAPDQLDQPVSGQMSITPITRPSASGDFADAAQSLVSPPATSKKRFGL